MISTLRDLFLDSVYKYEDSQFIRRDGEIFTYKQAYEEALKYSAYLNTKGVRPGERIIIIDENPMFTTMWILACILHGAMFIVLHRGTSTNRLLFVINDTKAVGIVDCNLERKPFYQLNYKNGFLFDFDTVLRDNSIITYERNQIISTDIAFLVYTSGSTGNPKGIMCRHQNVLNVITSINSFLKNTRSDRIGLILPLSFDYGLYQIFIAMLEGSSIVFLHQFKSPPMLIEQLKSMKITGFPALLSLLVPIARLNPKETQIDSLRYITNTGDSLPPTVIKKIFKNFNNIDFFSMYGLSECKRALYLSPELILSKPNSVGKPIPGTRGFIVADSGEKLPLGEVGELIIEGPHVMSGYWNAQAETKEKFIFGESGQPQLRTGDLFYQDQDGDYYFVARNNDIIKCRGFRISPLEVEKAILMANPHVIECLVYGKDDELLGQSIYAEVTVDDSTQTVTSIFNRCRETMEEHLIPTGIRIVESLPKTSSGKYNRKEVMGNHK